MKCNLASWDRALRFTSGIILTAYAIAGGPTWAYAGVYLIFTSAWGLCPVCAFTGFKTLKEEDRRRLMKAAYSEDDTSNTL